MCCKVEIWKPHATSLENNADEAYFKPALLKEEEFKNDANKYLILNLSKEMLLECSTNVYSWIHKAVLHVY